MWSVVLKGRTKKSAKSVVMVVVVELWVLARLIAKWKLKLRRFEDGRW